MGAGRARPLNRIVLWLAALLAAALLGAGCVALATPPGPMQLPAAPTPTPVVAPSSQDGADLIAIPFAEQLAAHPVPVRDLADLRRRLAPLEQTSAQQSEATREYEPGDTLDFWVHNATTAQNSRITAELLHKTDVAYAWMEVGQEYDARMVRRAIETFSKRIYPAVVSTFGRENTPGVDGDPRLHILHTTGMGRGVAGYFLGADQNPRSAMPFSNEKEMFYINLDWLNFMPSLEPYATTLAHEFQHMIHYAHDRNEEAWINEGLSVYSQETAGYSAEVMFPISFAGEPNTQLNTWSEGAGSNYAHYGGSYLFVRYLVDRFGPDIARALVAEPANGVEGVRRVLAAPPYNSSFEEVFGDWLVAAALDEPNGPQPGRYGYDDLNPQLTTTSMLPPNVFTPEGWESSALNFAAAPLLLSDVGDLRLDFAGLTETGVTAARPQNGAALWWSNRVDDSDARLTNRIDLSALAAGAPVTLSAAMWWDIEDNYDYAYVTASRDGENWQILPGTRTTLLNPSGNSLGHAYTGVSRTNGTSSDDSQGLIAEWVVEEFDLAAYAGGPLWLRFEYVTDDAVTQPGWLFDDLRIDAIGYFEDFESGADGWQSEGFLLGDGLLPQKWLVRVAEIDRGRLTAVSSIPVDDDGRARIEIVNLEGRRTALLFISGLSEGTTEAAPFTLRAAGK